MSNDELQAARDGIAAWIERRAELEQGGLRGDAINTIEACRQTHANWIAHYEECPGDESKYADIAGDTQHHVAINQAYDAVLVLLRSYNAEPGLIAYDRARLAEICAVLMDLDSDGDWDFIREHGETGSGLYSELKLHDFAAAQLLSWWKAITQEGSK